MNERRRLLDHADDLEHIEELMKAAAVKSVDGWKREFIELRKQFHEQIVALNPRDFDVEDLSVDQRTAITERYNTLRSTAAIHQANWPVVKIAGDDPEYRRSVTELRRASDDFVKTIRSL